MKHLSTALLLLATFALTGCAEDEYGSRTFVGVGFGPSPVWYDGYYGPYYGGYWSGGTFLYSDNHGGYLRDDGRHFRREHFRDAQKYHPAKPPHDGHGYGDHRDAH